MAIDQATAAAVAWFGANIGDDGQFVYRYDRDRGVEEGGYNEPRHAGVLWSLYQAERFGVEGAAEVADRGLDWALDRIQSTPVGPGFGRGHRLQTGATALLLAALDERRLASGDTTHDDLMIALGHTLVATVDDSGAVDAVIDLGTGPLPERSSFYPGETLWALARVHLTFPHEGFDEAGRRLRTYLVESREAEERPWPPISDHWGAYAFEVMDRWKSSPVVDETTGDWIKRQLELFGLQVRYESQRVGGITRFTRGPEALPAGVGTLGEGLGNWLLLDSRSGVLGEHRDVVAARAACVAGLLIERQTTGNDPQTHGAWFRLGKTQMDDQQHALSAMLLVRGHLSS